MIIKCPNCEQRFELTSKPINPPLSGASIHGTSIVTPNILRAVGEFMELAGPGRLTNHQLHRRYLEESPHRNWPAISRVALGKALKRLGATSWRDATSRGYEIPEPQQDPVIEAVQAEIPAPQESPFRYEHQDEYDENGKWVSPF